MTRRFSSIRTWIVLLILLPLVSLAVLWAFATNVTYGNVRQLQQSNQFQEKSLLPTQRLIDALQRERRLSLGRLGGAREATPAALAAQRRDTDRARADVRRHARDRRLRGATDRNVVERIDAFVGRLAGLDQARRGVDGGGTDRTRMLGEFSGLIDSAFAIYASVAPGDPRIAREATVLIAMARAREFLSREDALVTGAAAGGRLTAAERAWFAQLVGAQRYLYADNAPGLPGDQRERLERLGASPEFTQLRRLEDQLVGGAEPAEQRPAQGREGPAGDGRESGQTDRGENAPVTPPVDAASWRGAVDTVAGRLFTFENASLAALTERAEGIALVAVRRLAVAGALGLLAIVASTVIAVRVSRRLLGESRALARGVGDFTSKTLPRLSEHVRDGRPIAPAADVPDHDYRIGEIRQISESFVRARDAVLAAAARELEVRNGINEVFVNLARRNQALLHRQLSLLDTMERRTDDPAELSDLFRLDHLATRMRRHAEGLVILAGKSAGRGWRRPVPVVDVVRGAVAEVEDYTRVRVQSLPRLALRGAAVADVIHMLAEIVENATTYSPPQSPVRVSGHNVANGMAIEVEDRGLGMTEEDLASANERLADSPEFDPSDSARLGLFVVARLARQHGVTVSLRLSPYGGTTAIVLIPGELITDVPDTEPASRPATGPMATLPEHAGAGARRPGADVSGTGPVRLVAEPSPLPPLPMRTPSTAGQAPVPARPAGQAPHAEPAPAAPAASEPARAERGPARPEPAPARAEEPPPGEGELPRRRRQTHLAPQLRERVDADLAAEGRAAGAVPPVPLAAPVPAPPPAPDHPDVRDAPDSPDVPDEQDVPAAPEPRSPDDMRSIMSAMQRGWERGRIESGQAEAGQQSRAEEDDTP